MPIRTFCDVCDKLIEPKYKNTVSSDDKRWSINISTTRDDENYEDNRYANVINVRDGNGRAVRLDVNLHHSYVCEKCIKAIREFIYKLTAEYIDSLPTEDTDAEAHL